MKKLVILLAAALTFNSCSDSFLDLSNPSALSPSVYPKSGYGDYRNISLCEYGRCAFVWKEGYGERDILCGSYGRYGLDW